MILKKQSVSQEKPHVESSNLIQTIQELRKQKEDLAKALRKAQIDLKSLQVQNKTLESERQKWLSQNRRYIESLDIQKKEKVRLLTELSEVKNILTRKEAEITSLRSQSSNLQNDYDRLRIEVEKLNSQKINSLRQKQSVVNNSKILEARLEASEVDKKFLSNKLNQLDHELQRLKGQLSVITQKYHERQIGVQAIYKDEQKTKESLLEEFQNKISDKDELMKKQLQKYLNENSLLKQRIIELRGSLY